VYIDVNEHWQKMKNIMMETAQGTVDSEEQFTYDSECGFGL